MKHRKLKMFCPTNRRCDLTGATMAPTFRDLYKSAFGYATLFINHHILGIQLENLQWRGLPFQNSSAFIYVELPWLWYLPLCGEQFHQ